MRPPLVEPLLRVPTRLTYSRRVYSSLGRNLPEVYAPCLSSRKLSPEVQSRRRLQSLQLVVTWQSLSGPPCRCYVLALPLLLSVRVRPNHVLNLFDVHLREARRVSLFHDLIAADSHFLAHFLVLFLSVRLRNIHRARWSVLPHREIGKHGSEE